MCEVLCAGKLHSVSLWLLNITFLEYPLFDDNKNNVSYDDKGDEANSFVFLIEGGSQFSCVGGHLKQWNICSIEQ